MKVNFKSDFDFLLSIPTSGIEFGFPTFDFTITLHTREAEWRQYIISCRRGTCVNCFNDNGQIHIVCNSHNLFPGHLVAEFAAELPNECYPDLRELVNTPLDLGIELVREAGECTPSAPTIEARLPLVYMSAYDLAVKAGYNGTLNDYIKYTNEFPQVVEMSQMMTRLFSDMSEGKGEVAAAIRAQGFEADDAESFSSLAAKIAAIPVKVDGQDGIVDATGNGILDDYDLLNELRQHQRADYPYCCGALLDSGAYGPGLTLQGADAYYVSDGTFIQDTGERQHYIPRKLARTTFYVIYYFKNIAYDAPVNLHAIDYVVLSGKPRISITEQYLRTLRFRSYTRDLFEVGSAAEMTFKSARCLNELIIAGPTLLRCSISLPILVRAQFPDVIQNNSVVFSSCEQLVAVEMPKLERCTSTLIYNCYSINGLYLPSLKSCSWLVDSCASIQFIKFPNLEAHTSGTMLNKVNNLPSLELPALKTNVGNIIVGCMNLTKLHLPALQTSDSGYIVSGADSLESLELPALESISGTTVIINSCPALKSADMPMLTTASAAVFATVHSLSVINLPKLKNLSYRLCVYANRLTEVRLPALTTKSGNGDSGAIIDNVGALSGRIDMYLPVITALSAAVYYIVNTVNVHIHFGAQQTTNTLNAVSSYNSTSSAQIVEVTTKPGFRCGLNVSGTSLSAENLRTIIANLADNSGATALRLILGAALIAKLTDEDIAVATTKNYTIA